MLVLLGGASERLQVCNGSHERAITNAFCNLFHHNVMRTRRAVLKKKDETLVPT